MKNSQETDYYRREWSVVKRNQESVHGKIVIVWRVVFLVVLGVLFLIVAWFVNRRLGFSTLELFWMMAIFSVLWVGVLGLFWFQIKGLSSMEVHRYAIDASGLVVDGVKTSFESLDINKIKEILVNQSEKNELSLVTRTNKSIELLFPNGETKKKVIGSLTNYLSSS